MCLENTCSLVALDLSKEPPHEPSKLRPIRCIRHQIGPDLLHPGALSSKCGQPVWPQNSSDASVVILSRSTFLKAKAPKRRQPSTTKSSANLRVHRSLEGEAAICVKSFLPVSVVAPELGRHCQQGSAQSPQNIYAFPNSIRHCSQRTLCQATGGRKSLLLPPQGPG